MNSAPQSHRTPCPQRIFEDTGVAFTIGALGGTLFQFASSIFSTYASRRFLKLGSKLRYRVPTTAGNFALWGLSFSVCECGLQKIGIKGQATSAIIAGGITGGLLAAQRSKRAIGVGALFGFIILSIIELAIVFIEKQAAKHERQLMDQKPY